MAESDIEHSKENENSDDAVNEEGKKMEEMKPWEQHSGVISIPRFDYRAPSSLLQHSHSGFLITCPIKREKSATKEAIFIFQKFIGKTVTINESSEEITLAKRRRVSEHTEGDQATSFETTGAVDACAVIANENCCSVPVDSGTCAETSNSLSLVKLRRSGLLLFVFPRDMDPKVVDTVSNIFRSLESQSLSYPQWCHRIFPIQTTCNLEVKELQTVVTMLVNQFVNDKRNKVSRPVKFAVGYNRRGIEESEMRDRRSNGSNASVMLNRSKCFEVVAAAVKEAVADSVVDLKCPEFVVLLEVLPLSGIPENKVVVAVSVLPQKLVSTKPRLCVRPLIRDAKSEKRS